ncbi:MAG: ASKHA domain-containing protein [Desulfobacteraceae bacterium]
MIPSTGNSGNLFGWSAKVALPQPSIDDNTADVDRLSLVLEKEFGTNHVDVELSWRRRLPALLRESQYHLRCLLFKEAHRAVLIHAAPANDQAVMAGVAVDLGTTRVVMRLVDLEKGQPLAEHSFDNPQAKIGPDVLARIHHTDQPEGQDRLQRLIIDSVNHHVAALCRSCSLDPEQIHLFSVAGNTAMSHLFAGLPVRWMIREPYIPAVNRFGLLRAADLGLYASESARVFIFPNVGSYFGGDLIAGIVATGIHCHSETAILVDVGTNAEVVLGNREWLMACAGAAGPALEGGMSRMGTTAAPGVIDRVRIDPGTREFEIQTIDHLPPVGICGSGVIDLAAQLFLAGMVDIRGKFLPEACGPRLVRLNGMAYLTIVTEDASGAGDALRISQADMDSLMRSKAAMYTILETITGTMGLALEELETFYVAGTFGSLIDPRSAITIGMIPDLPMDRFRSMGNTSLEGASALLIRRDLATEIDTVRDRITYLELNVNQDFMNRFSAAKFLPHTHKDRFPSVKP